MNNKYYDLIRWFCILIAGCFIVGCAPSSYLVKEPAPSTNSYQIINTLAKNSFHVTDSRSEDDTIFHTGTLKSTLKTSSGPIDPIPFLIKNTQSELVARGIPADLSASSGDIAIDVSTFRMRNYRSNGFSPFVSFTMLSANVNYQGQNHRIVSYIKRGKVPVWSFDEIIDPCFNEPLNLVVKEFAAKLNALIYKAALPDDQVDRLAQKLNGTATYESYFDVYELAFSNNPKAIPVLVKLVDSPSEYVRLTAISGLGILGATQQMPLLEQIYNTSRNWSDRGMALKAIGDLNTVQSQAFLAKELDKWKAGDKEKQARWNTEIIELYL